MWCVSRGARWHRDAGGLIGMEKVISLALIFAPTVSLPFLRYAKDFVGAFQPSLWTQPPIVSVADWSSTESALSSTGALLKADDIADSKFLRAVQLA